MQLVLNHLMQLLPWAVVLTLMPCQVAAIVSEDGVSHQLRRALTVQIPEVKIEGLPGQQGGKKKKHDKRVMDAIAKFRAEICAKMKEEHGTDFSSYEACQKFMEDACHPGKDDQMDGDRKETTSEEGYCKEYFPVARKKAEEKVTHEEEVEEIEAHKHDIVAPSPFPAPGPAPAPAPAKAAAAPAPAPAGGGPAPSPGPVGVPGPAPVPGPFIPGITAGKPWGKIPDDEAWYYKKGGKDDGRLHMSEDMKLPTQGYWGKLVEHEDRKTMTDDWGREFGPQAGHASYRAICAQHPDNPWCYEQGFHRHHRSSCPAVAMHVLPLVFALLGARLF